MDVSPLSQTAAFGSPAGQSDLSPAANLRDAVEATRKLNSLEITGREFSVVRDPASQRFIVVVLDGATGTVLDQFPPEEILRMLAQLGPFNKANAGDKQE